MHPNPYTDQSNSGTSRRLRYEYEEQEAVSNKPIIHIAVREIPPAVSARTAVLVKVAKNVKNGSKI